MVREGWIDCAKATSIMLVVMLHACYFLGRLDQLHWVYFDLNAFLAPLRMPVFFMISGVLAYRALGRSWEALIHSKTWLYIYLLALWLTIDWTIQYFTASSQDKPYLHFMAYQFIFPKLHYWFIYALAIYFPLAKVISERYRFFVLLASASLFIVLSQETHLIENFAQRSIVSYFFFFYLGYISKELLVDQKFSFSVPKFIFSVVAYVGVYLLCKYLISINFFAKGAVVLIHSIMGVIVGFYLASMLSKLPYVKDLLSYISRNTLSIYLIHSFLWYLIYQALMVLNISLPNISLPVIMSIIAIGISLIIKKITDIIRFSWLYKPPI